MFSNIHTICGFASLTPDWRIYFVREGEDDGWKRYAMRVGPLYLSWSLGTDLIEPERETLVKT